MLGKKMKIITEEIKANITDNLGYDLEKLCPDPDDLLFIDIETTGFSAKMSSLYMIGAVYKSDDKWYTRQWFADTKGSEKEVLREFMNSVDNSKTLLHFNGNRFDIPYITEKCEKYGIENRLINLKSIDIYKLVSPFKKSLNLDSCKQKSIEHFLGIDREDKYTGGELIQVYKDYLASNSTREDLEKLLILHNIEDLRGMLEILPILNYVDLLNSLKGMPECKFDNGLTETPDVQLPVRATKVQANYYDDVDGTRRQEVLLKVTLPATLPTPIRATKDNFYLMIEGNVANIKAPLFDAELKYFYANYKDYYYLPNEDQAIHKSIASFVNNAYKTKATAATCYTRKPSQFLQEWDLVFTPFFKTDYNDKNIYFELDDNIKKSRTAMSLYAAHIMRHIFSI